MTEAMTGGKERVLGAVRQALGRNAPDAASLAAIKDRMTVAAKGPVPVRGQDFGAAAVARFEAEAKNASALVTRLDDVSAIPAFVAGFLADHNLPSHVRIATDAALASVDWAAVAPLLAETGPADPADMASLSVAKAGVAETGTLVLVADVANPGTLNSLPQHHIVVLHADRIVGHYEEVWPSIRQDGMPRAVVWVTGPSRTADIEQELLMGAHGPQMLQILIVGQPSAAES